MSSQNKFNVIVFASKAEGLALMLGGADAYVGTETMSCKDSILIVIQYYPIFRFVMFHSNINSKRTYR